MNPRRTSSLTHLASMVIVMGWEPGRAYRDPAPRYRRPASIRRTAPCRRQDSGTLTAAMAGKKVHQSTPQTA